MLSRLLIKNYALIDNLDFEPGKGLTIITGETGAGKSIMLGALSLLLGERADTKAIIDKERKTVVEAIFVSPAGEETIVRREISPSGRSRAFVDDSPVTLPLLQATTESLLDIHSQNANLRLNSREGQLAIIDSFADNKELVAEYRTLYKAFVAIRNKIKNLRTENEKNREAREVMDYQLNILDKLNPKEGELKEIERKYEMLSEADDIRNGLVGAFNQFDDEDGILARMRRAAESLEGVKMELLDPEANTENSISYRLKGALIELKDISETIESLISGIETDPVALAKTGARMNALYETARRFRVADDPDGLVKLRNSLHEKVSRLDSEAGDASELETEARKIAGMLKEKGELLSNRRKEGALKFAELLEEKARPLGLQNIHFEVAVEKGKHGPDGADNLEFMCAFNKNGVLMPMSRTASGGELSRLTLAIKSIMAEKMDMPTIIFDEIDTGVSGEIADKMGRMMHDMARATQIITITHLPQVAAIGEEHFKVFKQDSADRTYSSMKKLDEQERIMEIAGMLSGCSITDAAVKAATALLHREN